MELLVADEVKDVVVGLATKFLALGNTNAEESETKYDTKTINTQRREVRSRALLKAVILA